MTKGFKPALFILLPLYFSTCITTAFGKETDLTDVSAHPISTTFLNDILFYPVREAPATVVSLNNSLISAEISGQIIELLVQTGDEVKKDALLAKIDCESYEIAKQRANAALQAGYARKKYAKQRLDDAKHLEKRRVLSTDELNLRNSEANAIASDVGVLNADLKETRRRISKCIITAPFDAVIVERLASVGDYTTAGSPLVKLLDLNNLEVSGKIQQQDVDSLEAADKISFIVAGQHYPVTLRTVVPLVDSRIRSYESRLLFTGETSSTGAAGRLHWTSPLPHIPADYLVQRNKQLGVFIVKNNSACFYHLKGVGNGLPAPINLPTQTQIITTGRHGLIDGQLINIIQSDN
ncbi:MAG: efflux RND transporter periplasmic adaptor subunit [Methylococcaceae bacterium]|nr:efflux RND transporter periplasmic adaptor subunit [Methylococcaceae bacterium]